MTQPLANAELAIMELLWSEQPQTARQIREQLYPGADKAQHGTVQRLLQRLEDKGFVRRDRSLPVHLFATTLTREAYAGSQLESLADKLTGGSLAPLLTHLLDANRISSDDIAQLRALLDRSREEEA
ncbi:MAG: BlaI/MecI/CopY family transcriptional regulator [Planctomycetota bacterium]|jgi:predicted transcriptional regulator